MENKLKQQKVLNLLGLARRASKLSTGQDLVLRAIRTNKANIVFMASDCGQSTQKKFKDKCKSYDIALTTEFTKQELSTAIGTERSLIAVTDPGFGKKIRQLLFS
ncbi:L7Ae/L30e/S12e/Gadd45 family ribosomal protein [Ligilactobacillus apodemi]|uniref:50S ribosomal protein L7AE n=1 Tax=Ligilactobacillus apodemi DSM 16634 = JCM 16172 TaxID=1423724 RepID=A0A0R1TRL4_9LACO|nr:ribosomal L7Ae/L30e/S12e/Gadd45 family protein [Ligilactobacillus apodemi]KRL84049.1 50S ribosomal protein L7AE [Ligilactobacillus apodemi DSM 16634 = JCM 16172]MCR1900926.1 ribosomal L7Ae/L30e/S12e/Gadd45 family protein [Ligilactobacillus apodemi]